MLGNTDYVKLQKREFVSGYLQTDADRFSEDGYKLSPEERLELRQRIDGRDHIKKLRKIYKNIAGVRNDISHAGVISNAMAASKFGDKLRENYDCIRGIVLAVEGVIKK